MQKQPYCKRLIEIDLPIKQISQAARKEKNMRGGHIDDIHMWWARRPLATCRAIACAIIWPDPEDDLCPPEFRERAQVLMREFAVNNQNLMSPESLKYFTSIQKSPEKIKDNKLLRSALIKFIADFSQWRNGTNAIFLNISRKLTEIAHGIKEKNLGFKPLVVDPFVGGGAIPLEVLRIGGDAIGIDINPVAALISKISIEYIPQYGQELIEIVKSRGEWIKQRLKKRLGVYFPIDEDGAIPIAYLWSRTIRCMGPKCGVEVPIYLKSILSEKPGAEAAINIFYKNGELKTHIVHGKDFNLRTEGTNRRSSVTCPKCGYTTSRKDVEHQANTKGFGYRLLAVCYRKGLKKRYYRDPTERDLKFINDAIKGINNYHDPKGGIAPIPGEELPYLRSIFNVRIYGVDKWHKLFYGRQLLTVLVMIDVLKECWIEMSKEIKDDKKRQAAIECLALSVSNSLQYQCNITTYPSEGAGFISAFIQGQSLPMKMDFVEVNPLVEDLAGGYAFSLGQHISGLEYLTSYPYHSGTIINTSSLQQILPEDSCDYLITDPPYYDMIPFADCSDFYYVWLRRMLNGITPFNCNTELVPKDEEITQLAERNERYKEKTKEWFEERMTDVMARMRVAVKPSGVAVILFAHQKTAAWEAFLKAIIRAGWMITGSWPIDTENINRMRASGSATLSSTIHLVCRTRENSDGKLDETSIGDWRNVLSELPERIHNWMPRLTQEGIVGADAIFACLGPALEIFSRYSKVEKGNGDEVELREYLVQVWGTIAKEALNMIFQGAQTEGFEEDARLTAMWFWTLSTNLTGKSNSDNETIDNIDKDADLLVKTTGFSLEYDAARKIALGLGAHLENLASVVEIKGDIARLLPITERVKYLFGKENVAATMGRKKKQIQMVLFEEFSKVEEQGWSLGEDKSSIGKTVLDQLHQAMILFGAGRSDGMRRFLVEEGIGKDERFWLLAQALSALYPSQTDEKRWVDGVLARKKSLGF